MSFNKMIIVGNLGRDPELRYTPQGTPVCSFTLATNEKRKDKTGEMQDQTTWFRITLWGRQAEVASQYLTKGKPVYIEGRLRVEEWTDRDGKARYTLEVHATDMQFLGSGAAGGGGMGGGVSGGMSGGMSRSEDSHVERPAASEPAAGAPDFSDDDVPF